MKKEKFKPFWVVSVNNYICDASYSGKELKAKHIFPTFRKFDFIRDESYLDCFFKRPEISNRDLVYSILAPAPKSTNGGEKKEEGR